MLEIRQMLTGIGSYKLLRERLLNIRNEIDPSRTDGVSVEGVYIVVHTYDRGRYFVYDQVIKAFVEGYSTSSKDATEVRRCLY